MPLSTNVNLYSIGDDTNDKTEGKKRLSLYL